jgi:hypothetical protein
MGERLASLAARPEGLHLELPEMLMKIKTKIKAGPSSGCPECVPK